ncbi:DUF418 domain-containing protein [Komagataeibacter europaeus]|uniref:DUF418 domain-containing protein n=1 Tax=Komagataeibacter europaeus TaxID=33995 RepID=UPI001E5420A8|nr:DUF418 domain-containing protein [Komagataeibacter europaeus]
MAIDGARGLGVVGIGLCNAPGFAAPMQQADVMPVLHTLPDCLAWIGVQVAMQGRFVALFSLLFGVSMLWVGGDGRDRRRSRRLRRRLGWLALFGMVHGMVLWWGDILLPYALTGLVISPYRRWSATRLLVVGSGAYLAGVGLLRMDGLVALLGTGHVAHGGQVATERHDVMLATHYPAALAGLVGDNARDWLQALPVSLFAVMVTSGPLMLIGMGLYRSGYFLSCASSRRCAWFLPAGIGVCLLLLPLVLMQVRLCPAWQGARPTDVAFLLATIRLLGAPFGALAWLWLVDRIEWLQHMLAPIGRVALSAYLGQSIVARLGFAGMPHFYGAMDYAFLMCLTVPVVLFQVVVARIWCRSGHTGPAEALWRFLYLRA